MAAHNRRASRPAAKQGVLERLAASWALPASIKNERTNSK
jgi:hypothetical protein